MKRRIFSLLAVTLVAVIGVFLYQYTVFSGVRAQLEKESTKVADAYTALVDTDVRILRETYPLTPAQTRLIDRLTQTAESLKTEDMSIDTRVQAIGSLQAALHQLSASLGENPEIAQDGHFAQLQTAIGENGDVRDLLQAYNTTAVRWNNGIQSELGSLLGRIDGANRSILPYLRFDGGTEFVPVISL
jgi:hypothetical protein